LRAVYPVGPDKLSILDLLRRFTDKKWSATASRGWRTCT